MFCSPLKTFREKIMLDVSAQKFHTQILIRRLLCGKGTFKHYTAESKPGLIMNHYGISNNFSLNKQLGNSLSRQRIEFIPKKLILQNFIVLISRQKLLQTLSL